MSASLHAAPPSALPPALRLETAAGVPLDDPAALTGAWRRRPHAVAIELVARGENGGRRVLGRAVIGTRRDLASLRAAADRVGALLRARAGVADDALLADPLPVRRATPLAARLRGTARERLDRWTDRLLVERPAIGLAAHAVTATPAAGLGAVRWLPDRRFASPAPNGDDLLVWDDPRERRARLLVFRRGDDGRFGAVRVLLERDGDASRTSVFRDGARTYVLQTDPDRAVTTLWRLSDGLALVSVATVAPGCRLDDAVLFRDGGLLWIACTDRDVADGDNLCLWHATRPSGPWRPHRGNPVKIDVRSSRPAGPPFRADGNLWRPARDGATAPQGGAVMLNLIEELSPHAFRETPIRRLGPADGRRHAFRAVADWNGRTVVEGTVRSFRPAAALRRLAAPVAPIIAAARA